MQAIALLAYCSIAGVQNSALARAHFHGLSYVERNSAQD
jgi:hypothetical protein